MFPADDIRSLFSVLRRGPAMRMPPPFALVHARYDVLVTTAQVLEQMPVLCGNGPDDDDGIGRHMRDDRI